MDDDPVDFASTDSRLPVPTTLSFCGQVQGMITKQSVAQQHNGPSDQHRTSCHRCGNIRKKTHYCSKCPYVFCFRCVIKMQEVHGSEVFADGCPVVSVNDSFTLLLYNSHIIGCFCSARICVAVEPRRVSSVLRW